MCTIIGYRRRLKVKRSDLVSNKCYLYSSCGYIMMRCSVESIQEGGAVVGGDIVDTTDVNNNTIIPDKAS